MCIATRFGSSFARRSKTFPIVFAYPFVLSCLHAGSICRRDKSSNSALLFSLSLSISARECVRVRACVSRWPSVCTSECRVLFVCQKCFVTRCRRFAGSYAAEVGKVRGSACEGFPRGACFHPSSTRRVSLSLHALRSGSSSFCFRRRDPRAWLPLLCLNKNDAALFDLHGVTKQSPVPCREVGLGFQRPLQAHDVVFGANGTSQCSRRDS